MPGIVCDAGGLGVLSFSPFSIPAVSARIRVFDEKQAKYEDL
jgi:hypothetical protein